MGKTQGKIWYKGKWIIIIILPDYKRAIINGVVYEINDDNQIIIDNKTYTVYDLDAEAK